MPVAFRRRSPTRDRPGAARAARDFADVVTDVETRHHRGESLAWLIHAEDFGKGLDAALSMIAPTESRNAHILEWIPPAPGISTIVVRCDQRTDLPDPGAARLGSLHPRRLTARRRPRADWGGRWRAGGGTSWRRADDGKGARHVPNLQDVRRADRRGRDWNHLHRHPAAYRAPPTGPRNLKITSRMRLQPRRSLPPSARVEEGGAPSFSYFARA
jgi:hypothetical protein